MVRHRINLLIQPQMLGSAGWAGLYHQFALQYPGRVVVLHLQRFDGSLQQTLAAALRESGEAPYTLMPFPKKLWHSEDEYVIRLTWKKGAASGG